MIHGEELVSLLIVLPAVIWCQVHQYNGLQPMLLDLNLANKKTLIAWTLGQLLHLGLQQGPGVPLNPFWKPFLSHQVKHGVGVDITVWRVLSDWQSVTHPLKNASTRLQCRHFFLKITIHFAIKYGVMYISMSGICFHFYHCLRYFKGMTIYKYEY